MQTGSPQTNSLNSVNATPDLAGKAPEPKKVELSEDKDLVSRLDRFSIEEVVELKISRFFDQIGAYFPENVHELIMNKVEKPLLQQILRRVGGNQVAASKILGINRNTLRKKIKIYGL